jgi:predicted HTH domain antitoxin
MVGLSFDELQQEIEARIARLDEAQEEQEFLGAYGELLRTAALIAFQRAAELIDANNQRLAEQLREAGIVLEAT